MKFSIMSVTVLLTLFLQSNQAAAKTIYQWEDKSGKRHFSDKAPASNDVVKFHGNSLISIDIVQSKPIKLSKSGSAKRNKNRSASKLTRCTKIKTKIESLVNKLKQHLLAEKSDQYGRELSNLKWQKIKSC